jgi:hypothetical protein
MRVRGVVIFIAVALLAAITLTPFAGCGKPVQQGQEITVAIDSGQIRGTSIDGVSAYLGIPFAAPPVGDLRWREPQPVKPWEGIRVGLPSAQILFLRCRPDRRGLPVFECVEPR